MNSNSKEHEDSYTNPRRKDNRKSLSVSLRDMIPDYSELFENSKSSTEEAPKQ